MLMFVLSMVCLCIIVLLYFFQPSWENVIFPVSILALGLCLVNCCIVQPYMLPAKSSGNYEYIKASLYEVDGNTATFIEDGEYSESKRIYTFEYLDTPELQDIPYLLTVDSVTNEVYVVWECTQ